VTLPRWLPPLLFLLALAAAAWRAPLPAAPAFKPPPPAQPDRAPPSFATALLPTAAPSAHAATLAELADGRIAAAWFAGTREGAADVAVWFATLGADGWSTPQAIATRESTADATLAYVSKVGNPVLYAEGNRLHLWFVSVALGGWAGSSLNHAVSSDGGATWSPPTKLQTSPFLNISTLVRAPPVPLADGGLGLPAYHEFIAKHGEWLRFTPDGGIVDKVRMVQERRTLQPAVAVLDEQHALAVLRDGSSGSATHIRTATSADGGKHWPAATALPLPNPNSSVALLRLHSGRLLIAGNGPYNRYELLLWVSDDSGKTWRLARTAVTDTDFLVEYSYPALLQSRDGRIHLSYTWRRQGIMHAVFSEAWLDGGPP
jgi:predicted neuraminidase